MKILLIGEKYSSNLGDGVICNTVENLLQNCINDVDITFADILGKKGYNSNIKQNSYFNKTTAYKLKLSKMLTKCGVDTEYIRFEKSFSEEKNKYIEEVCKTKYDLAIFVGGQMFKDTFVFAIAKFVECLNLTNTPIVFNSCGVGEITSSKMREVLKKALSKKNVVDISSRDDINTINNYFLVNGSKNAVSTYDPALWTKEVYNVNKKDNSKTVGLGIMYTYNMTFSDLSKFWKNLIKTLDKKEIKWKLFCNGAPNDYEFALYILESLGYKNEQINDLLVPNPQRPKELVEVISNFNSIISFRLHSHIIAYSLDIPSVSIVWDEKLKYFFRSIGYENRCKKITDDSLDILHELEKAQSEGYDDELRIRQKKYLRDLLYEMINNSKVIV